MPSRATYPCTTFALFLAARTAADLSFTTKIAVDLKSAEAPPAEAEAAELELELELELEAVLSFSVI